MPRDEPNFILPTQTQIRRTATLVKLAEGRQMTASNTRRYLGLLLTLMISPKDRDGMVTLFMRHFCQLTLKEKALVILGDNEVRMLNLRSI